MYIEPYSKSKVDLFDNMITFRNKKNKVKLKGYEGVGPCRYMDLFSVSLSTGYELKRSSLKNWNKKLRIPSNNLPNMIFKLLEMNLNLDFNKKLENFINDIKENVDKIKHVAEKIKSACSIRSRSIKTDPKNRRLDKK